MTISMLTRRRSVPAYLRSTGAETSQLTLKMFTIKLQEASDRKNRCEGFWPDNQHDVKNAEHLHRTDDLTQYCGEEGHRILHFGTILRSTQIVHAKQNQYRENREHDGYPDIGTLTLHTWPVR